jgi:hypothetical protein
MKTKTAVLVVCATASLIALIGSASAPADVLCTTSGNPCGTKITQVHLTISSGASLSVKDTSTNEFATCTIGTISADITAQGLGVNPSGPITSQAWGGSGTGCLTTMATLKLGSVEFRTESGALVLYGKETETTLVAFGVSCTYGFGAGTKLGSINTGKPATFTMNAIVNKTAGSFLCPSTSRWSATWTVTNHSSLFVTNE